MQRLRFAATMAALFVLTFSAGAAFASPTAAEETMPLPVCQPADPMAFAKMLAAAPIGTMMALPQGGYDDSPEGLKRATRYISYTYTAPDGTVSRKVVIEGAEYLKPGLVFQVTGKLGDKDVVLNYVCHHCEECVKDVPVRGSVQTQRQSVPYLCAWGPVEPKLTDVKELCIRIVPPIEPAPTPNSDAVPTSAPAARPSELLGSDEPTPAAPSAALAMVWAGALARRLATQSVGEVMTLPDWATMAPTKAPEGWGRYLVKPDTYKTGQVVALITRHGGQSTFVRAVVVGTGTGSVDVDGQVKD
ncbi:MAG: hypothetical protein Q7R40_14355, partial [Phaeospirillum sp.]|nr:hypothetical protein [Phaeospirillum sp.]